LTPLCHSSHPEYSRAMRSCAVALSAAGVHAASDDSAPVRKVIDMMEQLQHKIEEDGKGEATLYEKFACFCRDQTNAKTTEITEGAALIGELKGNLATLLTDRNTTNSDIDSTEASIRSTQGDLEAENARWEEKKRVFNRDHTDLDAGKVQLDAAVATLKAARNAPPSLLQKAAQGSRNNEHVIDTIEELDGRATSKIREVEKTHVTDEHTHHDAVQGYQGTLDALEITLRDHQRHLASLNENIAETSAQLTLAQGDLYDDQRYLQGLTEKCEKKAKAWDQRAAMRSAELGTISEALAIIKGTVARTAEATAQSGHGQRVLLFAGKMDEQEAAADKVKESALVSVRSKASSASFVQVESHNLLRAGTNAPKQRVAALLKAKAEKLHSKVLAQLAEQAGEDPFKKVKQLIQQMLERLLEEAGQDAQHEGWCNEELKKTKQKRDYKSENVESATQAVLKLEGQRDQLREQKTRVTTELAEVVQALADANATRVQEHEDNEEAVATATEGKEAVDKAVDILDKFYKKSAKAKVELAQEDPEEPDAGFEGEYKGAQESGGILGMLETISSDFARTIKETNKADTDAQREFVDFKRSALVSKKKKEKELERINADLAEKRSDLTDDVNDLKTQQQDLNNAVIEWEKLRPGCLLSSGRRNTAIGRRRGKRRSSP